MRVARQGDGVPSVARMSGAISGTSFLLIPACRFAHAGYLLSSALSDREKSCLSWTALGKSSWEIGRILSISESTMIFHIKNAMKKLGAGNRTLAALKAVQLGLIEPVVEAESKMRRSAPES